MGELIPFRQPGREQFAEVEINQTISEQYSDAKKVIDGTHAGHAFYNADGKMIRLVATGHKEMLSPATIEQFIERYSFPDYPATYKPFPPIAAVVDYRMDLAFDFDA